jgi:hypothetical protein
MNIVDTPEGRRFAGEMTWSPGRAELKVEGRTRCDCGCGRPDRVEFTLCGNTIVIDSPAAVDALIETLIEARRKLWGA